MRIFFVLLFIPSIAFADCETVPQEALDALNSTREELCIIELQQEVNAWRKINRKLRDDDERDSSHPAKMNSGERADFESKKAQKWQSVINKGKKIK